MKRGALALVVSVALGLVGLYVVAGAEIFQPGTYRVRDWSFLTIVVGFVALLAQWLAPPAKIALLCRAQRIPLPYSSALLVHLASVLGGAATPSSSGQGPVIAVGLQRRGVSLGKGVGVAMQIIILDLIFYAWSVPLGLGYLIYTNTLRLPYGVELLAFGAVALSIAGAVVLERYPRLIVRLILAVRKWPLLKRFDSQLQEIARDYYHSIRAYSGMSFSSWILLQVLTGFGWFGGFTILWAILRLYGVQTDLIVILSILISLTLVSHFVPTPGGSGFIEAAVGLAVGTHPGGVVAAAVLVWRVASFYLIFLVGPLAVWLLYHRQPVAGGGDRKHG